MILSISTAVTRDVFVQTPHDPIEAVLVAKYREMVWTVVCCPSVDSGYIRGAMLGLGRALGAMVALLIILRSTQEKVWSVTIRRRLHLRNQDCLHRIGIW